MRRFTANAAHELRTPLTALRTSGQAVLADGLDVNDHRDTVADMLDAADQLSRVLDAMLLLAQADAGQIPLDLQRTGVDGLVEDVVRECEVLAQEKSQRLTVSCTAGYATVDRTIIRIAIANIVHNAIRYSPPSGTIRVRSYVEGDQWVVDVEDDGPGIPSAHHAHLFDRFYRVDPGRSRTLGGVGLGLAMARWSVELHGGGIQLRSEEGAGSTFRIVVPVERAGRIV